MSKLTRAEKVQLLTDIRVGRVKIQDIAQKSLLIKIGPDKRESGFFINGKQANNEEFHGQLKRQTMGMDKVKFNVKIV
jgi:hypothetical protein